MHTGDTVPCACGDRRLIGTNGHGRLVEYCLAGARCTALAVGTPHNAHDPTLAERQAAAERLAGVAMPGLEPGQLFGERLEHARRAKGLTVARFANAAGISPDTLRALENVPMHVDPETLHANQRRTMEKCARVLCTDAAPEEVPNRLPNLLALRALEGSHEEEVLEIRRVAGRKSQRTIRQQRRDRERAQAAGGSGADA
jgi:transcriptional regulator with XRE-family HTH domain